MNLFFNKFFVNLPSIQPTTTPYRTGYRSGKLQGPSRDVFQKSAPASDITFTSKHSSGSTKKGEVLKDLDNITCPYSGKKMITTKKMDKIEYDLSNCSNMHQRMDILEQYRSSMQPLEEEIFDMFKLYLGRHPRGNMNDCLRRLKPDCLAELRISQLKVMDSIDSISNKMDAKTALAVRKVTTDARSKIFDDKQDSIFKRKDLLAEIHSVTSDYTNKSVVRDMWAEASKLPKSTNDFNAFVVKYAKRSPDEISARLLRPSVASIEHIRPANPDSSKIKNGEDDLTNFMLVSRDWNSGRSNTPLPEFVEQHPNIPEFSQQYMDDIINAIHKEDLLECDWYPYVLREKLYNESQGLINVSTDKYEIDQKTAFNDAPEKVVEIYNKLLEENEVLRDKTITG